MKNQIAKYYVYYDFIFGKSKPSNTQYLGLAIMVYKIYNKFSLSELYNCMFTVENLKNIKILKIRITYY